MSEMNLTSEERRLVERERERQSEAQEQQRRSNLRAQIVQDLRNVKERAPWRSTFGAIEQLLVEGRIDDADCIAVMHDYFVFGDGALDDRRMVVEELRRCPILSAVLERTGDLERRNHYSDRRSREAESREVEARYDRMRSGTDDWTK